MGHGHVVNGETKAVDRWREEKKALEAPGRWHEEMPAPGVVLQYPYPSYCISNYFICSKIAEKAAEQHKHKHKHKHKEEALKDCEWDIRWLCKIIAGFLLTF